MRDDIVHVSQMMVIVAEHAIDSRAKPLVAWRRPSEGVAGNVGAPLGIPAFGWIGRSERLNEPHCNSRRQRAALAVSGDCDLQRFIAGVSPQFQKRQKIQAVITMRLRKPFGPELARIDAYGGSELLDPRLDAVP